MADNVPISAGTGTSIATDDVGGVHYQRVKLDGGSDGLASPILGDTSNGLDVDVTRTPKGTKTFSAAAPTTLAGSILAANSGRKAATIVNAGSVPVYLGSTSGVTSSNGLALQPGQALQDDVSTDAWYAITASGTGDLRICEVA